MGTDTTTVVVLGMHRSGTSMTSNILKELGVDMGNYNHTCKSQVHGHFERKETLNLNIDVYNDLGRTWDNPPTPIDIINLKDKYNNRIKDCLINLKGLCGFKDPRTVLTLPLYIPHLKNPKFIITTRDDHSIVDSLSRRDDMPLQEAMVLVKYYTALIDSYKNLWINKYSYIEVKFDNTIYSPETTIKQIIDYLSINPTEEQYKKAIQVIKK